jgi:hypothetical protein
VDFMMQKWLFESESHYRRRCIAAYERAIAKERQQKEALNDAWYMAQAAQDNSHMADLEQRDAILSGRITDYQRLIREHKAGVNCERMF